MSRPVVVLPEIKEEEEEGENTPDLPLDASMFPQAAPVATSDLFLVHDNHPPIGVAESWPLPPSSHTQVDQLDADQLDSIFVSLASYRDPECANTLIDLFTRAKYPERVFVGVCQQNADEDPDCMVDALAPYEKNIRMLRMTHFEAQGPMYARSLIEQFLYQGELFYLQIDSHMLFVPDWDEICIRQLALCPSDKPILTTYPNDFDRLTRQLVVLPDGSKHPLGKIPPTFIRFREFHKRLQFTEQEKENFRIVPETPQPSLFWAAGFSFSLGELIRAVPYDPHCPFLFLGEEMGLAMRYYTHGWDFFAPGVNIVYHLLKRTYRKTFWEQVYRKNCVVDDHTRLSRKEMEEYAVQRCTALVRGQLPPHDPYNLGHVRSLQDWENYTGVNIARQWATVRAYQGLSPYPDAQEIRVKQGPRGTAIRSPQPSRGSSSRPHAKVYSKPSPSSTTQSPPSTKRLYLFSTEPSHLPPVFFNNKEV